VGLLSAKGIERESVTPKEKVNQKRIAQGRAPFSAYTVIRLSKYRTAKGIPHGGTHVSPIPHFRRGHVRTLETDRKVIVRPCFVMADPGSMPTYKVKAEGV
jgi:Ser-tRNA(Ala) deacylase AlaX